MIDADDLAMLAAGFSAAMTDALDDGRAADAALRDLGWVDLLMTAPSQGAAMAFAELGASGAIASLLDDVLLGALGLDIDIDIDGSTCVALPAPQVAQPPGRLIDGLVHVDGLVSSRLDVAARVAIPTVDGDRVMIVLADAASFRTAVDEALDPGQPYRRLRGAVAAFESRDVASPFGWPQAIAAARLALAWQLIGASRRMLEMATTHARDRVQFGKPIASFQALRHKMAEVLVAIEAAQGVAEAAIESDDPLAATAAKSLAGKAARLAATNVQQVLAGIGFTTEHRFHLYLKRTMVIDALFGSAKTLPAEIGATLLARGHAPQLVEL